jgi:Uma2 family endonuclease
MATIVADPWLEKRLRARRRALGHDRWDEVWDGVYFMPPLPNEEHQELSTRLGAVIPFALGWESTHKVYVGINVSDREQGWKKNYRCSDVAAFLAGTQAKNCGPHWCGGPDFVTEIVSPRDRSRKKLRFYSRLGTRELLLIDRRPWALELHLLQNCQLVLASKSTLEQPTLLASSVLPLSMRLLPGEPRPRIEVIHRDGVQRWMI